MSGLPSETIDTLARHWTGRLATYRLHRNDEHREALISEALRFAGIRLEADLSESPYWASAPLARRVAVLLYLLDRGAIVRSVRNGRATYQVAQEAEKWARTQAPLAPYLNATLELLAAVRRDEDRRSASVE
jgi:hypothetical protein